MATGLVDSSANGGFTLSNGNLTAATNTGGNWRTIYADARMGTGSLCVWQVTLDSLTNVAISGAAILVGIEKYSALHGAGPINTGTDLSGNIVVGGTSSGKNIGANAAGDVITVAFDGTNKRLWMKRNTGNWNNDGTANPATNTGGIDLSTWLSTDTYVSPAVSANTSGTGGQFTCNFGATALTYAPPSGFYSADWTRVVVTSGTSVSQPTGWTDANWIEAVGAGSSGGSGASNSNGLGGGGGAFAAKWGVTGLSWPVTVQIGASNGAATTTGATKFNSTTVVAAGAGTGVTTGGTTANSTGDLKFAGGNGVASGSTGGGAGGGAGRGKMKSGTPWSVTGTGGDGSTTTGGTGNNGTTTGGSANTAGTASTVEYGTAGSGSGSGGRSSNGTGGAGGNYGAGGGGGRGSGNAGGAGAGGVLALYYYKTVPPIAYTLTSAGGSFTLSGSAATLKAARTLAAATGSFTLTGNAAALRRGYQMVAGNISFMFAGSAATLAVARKIIAANGAFTLTGNAAALKASRTLSAGQAVFTLIGNTAALKAARRLAGGAGAYSLTGSSAGFTAARKLAAGTGVFTLSGNSAGLYRALALAGETGVYAFVGNVADLILTAAPVSYTLNANTAGFTLTGSTALLTLTEIARTYAPVRGVGSIHSRGAVSPVLTRQAISARRSTSAARRR